MQSVKERGRAFFVRRSPRKPNKYFAKVIIFHKKLNLNKINIPQMGDVSYKFLNENQR
jgi:hypothetical protein